MYSTQNKGKVWNILGLLSLSILVFYSFLTVVQRVQQFHAQNIINPSGSVDSFAEIMEEQIVPQLQTRNNDFSLRKSNSLVPQAAASDYVPGVSAGIAVDLQTGEILFDKNSDKTLPIASLTKVMTAIVALDLASATEEFTVTDYAARQIPTRIGVVVDEKMRLDELMAAILLTSANDAASVIQVGIDKKYNAPVFIKAMNEKAELLGLKNTSFANPQGFDDDNNYSTLQDMAILSSYALEKYPLIADLVSRDYAFLPANASHKQFDLLNWNGLLGVYPGAMGMKIGNTGRAGKTTIVVAERNGKKILSAVLGAEDLYERDLVAADLLDIGFEKTMKLPRINVTRAQLQQKYLSWKY